MRKQLLPSFGILLFAALFIISCDVTPEIVITGEWLENEGEAPTGTNLITNGEFDDVVSGVLDPGDYNNWNNWNVAFTPSVSGWSSIFPPSGSDTGYGDSDFDAVISWGPKNYSYILTQEISSLNAGEYQASMMFLAGAGNYEKITIEVIGDSDGSLGSFTHSLDNSQVAEATSNDVTWQNSNWSRAICNVTVGSTQSATLRIQIEIGEGGVNPYTRLDDVFLVAVQ
ncbi:MAG: hypothetical protein JXR86_03005 [Spirochaetales bacterium]|nr:hypothetical protein [Spirochaetales bacterium]